MQKTQPEGAIIETMDWNDLRFLLAVRRRGSLAAAAKDLGVTKATMSRRLAALEEALGAKLFDRKPNGLQLTVMGQEAVAVAERVAVEVEALAERASSAADDKARGVVRLTAPPWLAARVIIPALPELKRAHPDLDVQLIGTNSIVNLSQRDADLAIRNVKPSQQSLTARKVGLLGGCVYASRLYIERRGAPRSRAEVRGHDILTYEGLGGMPGFEWLREPETGGVVVFSADDPEALVSAATAGLGLTAVPCMLGDMQPALARIDSLGLSKCDLFLVTQESLRSTARIRVVSEFLVQALARNRLIIEGALSDEQRP